MRTIFVNLKRWEIPRSLGGVCPEDDPERWIRRVMRETVELGLGKEKDVDLVYLLPEAFLLSAHDELAKFSDTEKTSLFIGCQGVFREDVAPGGNFGGFTTNLPASSARLLGASWAIVGHSEERKDKLGVLTAYDSRIEKAGKSRAAALESVNGLINQEVLRALERDLNVLLCVGETAEERGEGTFEDQKPRIEEALRSQVEIGIDGTKERLGDQKLVFAYEPIWAIGPGKTPPGGEYIGFVASLIKKAAKETHGITPEVVYGGGLKEENAAMISGVSSVDGGLVALTKFTQPIGFDTNDLRVIVDKYMQAEGQK